MEGSLTQDLLESKDLQSSLQVQSGKSGNLYQALLPKESYPANARTLSFGNDNLQTNLTPKNRNQNAKNSSSTELTRGALIQDSSNQDAGHTDQAPQIQKKSNFTFHLSNSQRIKSQHSMSGNIKEPSLNFYKQAKLKQSNSDTQNNFAYSKRNSSPIKQTFSFPFPTEEHKTSPTSLYQNAQAQSPDFAVNQQQMTLMFRVSGKELEGMVQMSQVHVDNLEESRSFCGALIKRNRALERKSRKIMSYTRELEKKVRVLTQISEQILKRFTEQERLCTKYSETILQIMQKLTLLSSAQKPMKAENLQMEDLGNILDRVGHVLSQQNIDKFKSFLSHQNQFKESMLMSPPKRRKHTRRISSSMKSLSYNKNSKHRACDELLSPYNDSHAVEKKKQLSSMFSQPVQRNQFKDHLDGLRKDHRVNMRRSEVIQKKLVEKASREIQKGDRETGTNLINQFDRNSNVGDSINEYGGLTESSVDDLYKEIMTSENISNHQSR